MQEITTCLWFDGVGDDAVDHYVTIFPNSRRMPGSERSDDPSDVPMTIGFELNGRPFMALNGGPHFAFSPAISFVINCVDQAEVDHYWDRLVEGGSPSQCGWLADRFGLSWQIVPNRLGELLGDPDPDRAQRAMAAMMTMVKLDIAALEAAADG